MSQLDLLRLLQDKDRNLIRLKEELCTIKKEEALNSLVIELNRIQYDLADKETKKDLCNMKIQRHNNKIHQLGFRLKEIESKLYGGEISDLKQLTHLENESGHISIEINDIETEVLQLMENVDKLDNELDKLKKKFELINAQHDDAKEKYKHRLVSLESEIANTEDTINSLVNEIDIEIINIYNNIKSKKGNAIADVVEDMCTGCHMSIPVSLIYKIKGNKSLNYCDNCGRLLYYLM